MQIQAALFALLLVGSCAVQAPAEVPAEEQNIEAVSIDTKLATFAGGCFWCMEPPFESLDGVAAVTSGYAGGEEPDPTYEQVSSGSTGHVEAIQVRFDPEKVSYTILLDTFWRSFDPTDGGGQFVDRGTQYQSAIFYHDEDQKIMAESSRQALNASGRFDKPIITPIKQFTTFYPAEEYHQDYHQTHPIKYKYYSTLSGRPRFLKETWGDEKASVQISTGQELQAAYTRPTEAELQSMLSPLQYHVTQEEGTERAFDNEYWDNSAPGIYVDVVSGEPLFSSLDKYKSGTGWPSFTRSLAPENIVEKADYGLHLPRTEIRSKAADSHLGHVFKDGPEPTGLRYCMNSAALRFIPEEDLEKEGYEEYQKLFE